MVPQFGGIEIARQSFYSPTAGPLVYELRDGVWARRGHARTMEESRFEAQELAIRLLDHHREPRSPRPGRC